MIYIHHCRYQRVYIYLLETKFAYFVYVGYNRYIIDFKCVVTRCRRVG